MTSVSQETKSKLSGIHKLHIEDALEDTPQLRACVNLFEKDTNMLKKYLKAFSSSCSKILNAQVRLLFKQNNNNINYLF